MTRSTRRVGERGQVTIPKWIREQEGITGGDEVVIDREDGKIVIRKAVTEDELAAAYEEHADRARRVNEEWEHASSEANEEL
ncbi:AbrB family transcriptional regulator [Halobacteriales archaeon SW_6_65_15]|nr:MAG: AbrB family transcriptional regulator [Halobacteriales archaeon SW_6_65_15]